MRKESSITNRLRDYTSLQEELSKAEAINNLENMQVELIDGAKRILNAQASNLILIDENNSEWIICKSLNNDKEWIYRLSPREGKGLTRECLQSGNSYCVKDVSSDHLFDPSIDNLGNLKVYSFLCAPLITSGEVIGVIQVLNKMLGEFDEFDQSMLLFLARQTSSAIQLARLTTQLSGARNELDNLKNKYSESNSLLTALSDNLPISFYAIDREFTLKSVNRSRAQRIGQLPKALVGQLCYRAFYNFNERCPKCRASETFRKKQVTQRNERRENKQEETTNWDIYSYPIMDERGRVNQVMLVEQDVTERQHLETILAQSEKLAAVGQLAAGIAHEINNPLTAIIANAQILHRELPPDHDLQESVDLIARAGARAAQVVRNLLDFARKEEYSLRLTDLNETIRRALDLIQHEVIARDVALEFNPDPNLPSILASQDHLQSVWLNLLLNSIDSLDKIPAEIRVTTEHVRDEIYVSVADNGKGIPPENLTRIFEPFYTTKAPGRGTGLGLSVSHRIIKQHGGHIRVESQLGLGTKFTVMLPAP